ncbi:hypothetical protein [Pedobacter frigoris]|uniref:BZIP transcription factor n=1 Tax=Pedobacter frigoris TaxID=2571272 RepID=A0A4U1C8U1_9SPHI|nr:hypothetical protein [Pedobacter frigoris]TKC02814.1 hypothetical protein FA047_20120 [Pedobacter frigoris]
MKKICILMSLVASYGASFGQTNTLPTTGNVGIGTLSPTHELSVNGDVKLINFNKSYSINYATLSEINGGASTILGNNVKAGASTNSVIRFNNGSDLGSYLSMNYVNGITFHTAVSSGLNTEISALDNEAMRIAHSGRVGIATTNLTEQFNVGGNIAWTGNNVGNNRAVKIGYSGGNYGGVGYNVDFTSVTGTFNRPMSDRSSYLEFNYGGFKFFGTSDATSAESVNTSGGGSNLNLFATITAAGSFGIGTASPSEKLEVNGKIRAREIKVETANWPDYVFLPSYKLPTLQETEKHIKEKGHLPGIPSASEVKANGVELGSMNAKLLQKIEELTLHLIEKNKQLQEQKLINSDQEDRLRKLEMTINKK